MNNSILFLDAYDSFSNNISSLLRDDLNISVEIIRIDDPRFVLNDDAFFDFLDHFDAVVAGPGPGQPGNSADVGLIARLWNLPESHLLPVLGICLGFQSLALAFGATVERLQQPRHGLVTPIFHSGSDIFAETGDITATQYHSLHVKLGHVNAGRLWLPSRTCPQLVPLAWDVSDARNGPVLMAARHCHSPFWGVQYHPESICTNEAGRRLIKDWWREVCRWHSSRPSGRRLLKPEIAKLPGLEHGTRKPPSKLSRRRVHWTSTALRHDIEVTDIVKLLREEGSTHEPILLESGVKNGKPVNAETGRFSIIGLHDSTSMHIRYPVSNHRVEVIAGQEVLVSRSATISDVFGLLEEVVEAHRASGGPGAVPFWGGMVGFISYEAGLDSIDVAPPATEVARPDLWFVLVERSIIVDHVDGVVYVQSIRDMDAEWLSSTEGSLGHFTRRANCASSAIAVLACAEVVSSPQRDTYQQKVRDCQDHLRAGSSYELCLTDTTRISSGSDPWFLYSRMRALNPAPFGTYLQLPPSAHAPGATKPGVCLLSSSPERFLSWSRDGRCQFRPIKGTVKKTPNMTRAMAEELLSAPKERAENLMIVDLIRHDLNGVRGILKVCVPKLMVVEEYATVFQLVSVIEGDLREDSSGIAALAASLPPGSMTGAPKKRSCDLLKSIEGQQPRGLYSGVVGYLDVGGGGDFSVVIRSAFRWSDVNEWRVGAGGAVTALSDPEAEWEEMLAKRESLLSAFGISK